MMKKWPVLVLAIAVMLTLCVSHEANKTTPDVGDSTPTQIIVFEDDGVWKAQIIITLPNPCHKIEFLGVEREGNTFIISFRHTPPKPDEICIQVLQKYNKTLELGKLEKGDYRVVVKINDVDVKELPFKVKD
ncbi:hypothetical protein [Archaeoglobus veneficus]|uniref:Uncharacterized protein n=1 Tax=Archaeoglobus veneficus (strain DSM 11195 / SNP6) TaxID=693661 RepID=F2KP90_ARCVS|nr:hypothetical protein [Archaeoglobus veneficus]AEA47494.1 hypothetical protein Arcve_1492 [Archaeoglobus veneficus SNP6]